MTLRIGKAQDKSELVKHELRVASSEFRITSYELKA